MATYTYCVWFENRLVPYHDQDREWCACINIDAATSSEAQGWGDTLALARFERIPSDIFVHSEVQLKAAVPNIADWSSVPNISAGDQVSEELIGW